MSAKLDGGRIDRNEGGSHAAATLGRTGRDVSAIGLGTWQLGADWGEVSEDDALAVLAASVDHGVTLFDTADVYGDGRSETLIGRFLAERPGHGITVATKMGRRMPQEPANYTPENFRAWTERSRRNLGVETLDLVQLHCPPTAVIEDAATYDALDALVADGAIAAYGVSVETCEQALAAIARPNVTNMQIIFNPFRLKPLDEVLPAAEAAGVAIFARVPLASGLLSGRYTAATTFADERPPHATTVTARRSIAARRSRAWTTRSGSRPWPSWSAAVPEGVVTARGDARVDRGAARRDQRDPRARGPSRRRASNADAAALLDGGFDVSAVRRRRAGDVYDRRLRKAITRSGDATFGIRDDVSPRSRTG